jgi:hypothetical protein
MVTLTTVFKIASARWSSWQRGRMVLTHVMRQWLTPSGLPGACGNRACLSHPARDALSPVTVMGKAASIRDRMEASSTEDCCTQDDPKQQ